MKTPLRHAGLSLANTIAVTVQTVILVIVLNKRLGGVGRSDFLPWLGKVVTAAVVMCAFFSLFSSVSTGCTAICIHGFFFLLLRSHSAQ